MKNFFYKNLKVICIYIFILLCILLIYKHKNTNEFFIILNKIHSIKNKSKKKIKIPLNIWQTHVSNDLPQSSYDNVNKLITLNPEFKYQFFDNEDMRKYIENNFDNNVLRAYDKINPGAGKADIWRLAIILKEGGIYIDLDKILIENPKPFIDIIDENDEFIHGRNWHIWGQNAPATNATLCAVPNHPVIKYAFESIIDSILNDKPLKNIDDNKGWAKLEDYTGTPHLWKALKHYTGNTNMKEGNYNHNIVISEKIEKNLKQNPNYGNDLKELKVKHWTQQEVFTNNKNNNIKIAVCMWYNDDIKDYANITYNINKEYCKKYNYDIIKSSEVKLPHRKPHWERLPLLLDTLNTNKYDYVMWIDADACFNFNSNKTIEKLIIENLNKDIIFSRDIPSIWKDEKDINSGVIILKNTKYVKDLIKFWYTDETCFIHNGIPGNDQGCLRWTLYNNYKNIKDKSIIIPFGEIQIFSIDKTNKEALIFHLAGINDKKIRINNFNNLYNYYIQNGSIKNTQTLKKS